MDFNMHQELLPDISTSTSSPIIDSATSAELDESQCKLSGYLNIQVEHKKRFGQRWKRRYVIVSEGCLNVYLNENAKNLKKSYPICAFERVTPYENDYTFKLTFREANRPPIVCSCKSSLNRTEWVRQIDTAISFGGDSGFESGEMLQHKTPDIHTTGLHPAYSTVDESKLYKARQDATGTSEDFSCVRRFSCKSLF